MIPSSLASPPRDDFPMPTPNPEPQVKIFDDDAVEPDEHFFIQLHGLVEDGAPPGTQLGAQARTRVTIINDDYPGTFVFPREDVTVKESAGEATIEIQRVQGCSGAVSLQYRTLDGTALEGKNYHGASGTLEWAHADVQPKSVTVSVVDDDLLQGKQYFEFEISAATGGAIFDETTDGDKEKSIARVTIEDDEVVKSIADRAMAMMGLNQQAVSLGTASWREQFAAALSVGGGGDDDADGEGGGPPSPPGAGAWFMHVLSLPFKLLCACVPPTVMGGGWPCFCVAIALIGVLTALIGDVANLLGCALGLKNSCVAITLVALGTSLPDTFASRAAARGDSTADAAVGNVTGSNAVNVFLGLGLSWVLGAAYWTSKGVTSDRLLKDTSRYGDDPKLKHLFEGLKVGDTLGLIVPAGDLAMSVTIFVICAVLCIGVLTARRVFLGAELGLQYRVPTAAFLCSLWVAYIVLSCLNPFG